MATLIQGYEPCALQVFHTFRDTFCAENQSHKAQIAIFSVLLILSLLCGKKKRQNAFCQSALTLLITPSLFTDKRSYCFNPATKLEIIQPRDRRESRLVSILARNYSLTLNLSLEN